MDNPEQGGPVVAEAAAELPAVTEQAETQVATEQAAESQPEPVAAATSDQSEIVAAQGDGDSSQAEAQPEVAVEGEQASPPADPSPEEQAAQIDHPGATDEQAAEMAANAEPNPAEDGDAFGPVVLPQEPPAEGAPLAEQIADVAAQAGDDIAAAEGQPAVSAEPEPAPVVTRDLIRTNKMTPKQAAIAQVGSFAHAVAEMARLKDQAGEVATLVGKHRDEAKAKGDVVLASLLDVACKGLGATQRGLADILDEI